MPTFLNADLQARLLALGSRAGAAVLILIGFWLAAAMVGPLLHRVGHRAKAHHAELLELGARCARVALKIVGVVTALGTVGVDVSALVAGLGLTGFALGFALKDALSNILAGVMILFYRPFQRGEYILTGGFEGLVTDVDLRYTTLQTGEKRILIPNSSLLTNAVVVQRTPATTTASGTL